MFSDINLPKNVSMENTYFNLWRNEFERGAKNEQVTQTWRLLPSSGTVEGTAKSKCFPSVARLKQASSLSRRAPLRSVTVAFPGVTNLQRSAVIVHVFGVLFSSLALPRIVDNVKNLRGVFIEYVLYVANNCVHARVYIFSGNSMRHMFQRCEVEKSQ